MLIISRHIDTLLNYRRGVSCRSDFLAYNNFPEVYHGQGISKAAFYGVEHVRRRRKARHNIWGVIPTGKRKIPQDMDCGGRCAPGHLKKIRNYLFSDLTGKRVKDRYVKHIHMSGICIGLTYAYPYHLHMT